MACMAGVSAYDTKLSTSRGGKIIKEIRETSGATIKILTENELPLCALHNDRIVQCAPDFIKLPASSPHVCITLPSLHPPNSLRHQPVLKSQYESCFVSFEPSGSRGVVSSSSRILTGWLAQDHGGSGCPDARPAAGQQADSRQPLQGAPGRRHTRPPCHDPRLPPTFSPSVRQRRFGVCSVACLAAAQSVVISGAVRSFHGSESGDGVRPNRTAGSKAEWLLSAGAPPPGAPQWGGAAGGYRPR